MKKFIQLIIVSIFLFPALSKAQSVDVSWSEQYMYDNKKDGFFDGFIGGNSKFVYAKFSNYAFKPSKQNRKVKIIAFNKKTMDKVATVGIVGFADAGAKAEKDKKMRFYKSVVFENTIYLFWTKETKAGDELYVQTYDAMLKPLKPLKKIYEMPSAKGYKSSSLFVMANKEAGEKIIIGGELAASKGEKVKVEYKLLSNDFSFLASNQVELPVVISGKMRSDLSSSYVYGDDGNLYVKTYVTMSKDEKKEAKKGEQTTYPILSIINLNTGILKPFTLKFENKNLFNFDFIITHDKIKLFGFFCDLTKDKRGYDTHGIFYTTIDSKSLEISSMNFSAFTKQQLDKLFIRDKEDQVTTKKKKKSKNKGSDERLKYDYIIEQVKSVDKDNLVLFCSRMNNYTVTTCDSKGNCTTRYYCEKRNVTAFKVDINGTILWASNIDRSITYDGWNIPDMTVAFNQDKFYVIYGSRFDIGATKKNRKSRKSKKEMVDRFEYATFDYETGATKKSEYVVNPEKTKKADKKTVNPRQIEVMDELFYVNSMKMTIKPLPVVIGCLVGLVCFPAVYAPFVIGNSYKGKGNLGVIKPLN